MEVKKFLLFTSLLFTGIYLKRLVLGHLPDGYLPGIYHFPVGNYLVDMTSTIY